MPDFYGILGVPRTAAPDDIKRAYRKLARDSHPDANPEDPHAEERFKAVNEAYAVLSDPEKRQRYDTFGDANAQGIPAGFGGDFSDILSAFFGGGSPFGGARTRARTSAMPGRDVAVEVEMSLEEAVFGASRSFTLNVLSRCATCGGDGCAPGTFRGRCSRCGGQGEIRQTRNTMLGTVMTSRPCDVCAGSGEAPSVPCETCGGDGRTAERREETVDVPAGVDHGTTLRLRGRGEHGVRGGQDGDVFLTVRVRPHEIFERNGNDLECALHVPLTQAVLGAKMEVPTLDGPESLAVPAGTQHGEVLRLRGKGAARLDGRGRGDLLVHVSVAVPMQVGVEERALFEQLAKLRGEEVNGEQPGLFRRLRDTFRAR
jgi:molecular chaperone DnaJ